MTIFAIIGKPRTGKTLFLTSIGFNDYHSGRKVFTNYKVNFEHERLDIEDLLSIQTMEMETSPKTVLIQEASKWFDARRSARRENVMLSSFTGQSGKREIDIYYDDQFMTRIDRGLRDVTDFSFICNCIRDRNKQPMVFEYEKYGGYFLYPTGQTIRFPAYIMHPFYEMYNTREATQSLESQY